MSLEAFPQQTFDDSSISDTESSLHGATAVEEEGGPPTSTTQLQAEELCNCQRVYEDSGNEKKVLYLMCVGLNHNGLPLFSFENEPWSLLPKSSLVRPKNTDYVKEVARRAEHFNISPAPRPSNWTRAQIMEWLEQNTIREEKDIEFLTNEVSRLCVVLERAQQQTRTTELVSTNAGGSGRNWRGAVPYLRIIMSLTQDHVKRLFLTRANVRTRQELDARNSETRPKTVFEVVSDMWNSPDFNPVAPASDCHADFQNATVCSYEHVEALSPATPRKIEDIFVSMRSDLLRIITRWEQSGQGEGGMDPEEEEEYREGSARADDDSCENMIGSLAGRPARALQTRAAFLNGRPSYLLYFWEMADSHQLLQSSLQRLNNNIAASDGSFASVSTAPSSSQRQRRGQRGRQQDGDLPFDFEASVGPLSHSIQELVNCQRQLGLDQAEQRQHEQQLVQQREESTKAEQARDRIFRRRTELSDLARKYRKLNAELDLNLDLDDERSARLSEFYNRECRLIEEEMRLLVEHENNNNGAV